MTATTVSPRRSQPPTTTPDRAPALRRRPELLGAAPATGASFANLGLTPVLVDALRRQGLAAPFPIQAATLPDALAGRDILGRGRTGSGKTLAFGLALLDRIAGRRAAGGRPLALVLVPTRELAQQVTIALRPYAQAVRLRCVTKNEARSLLGIPSETTGFVLSGRQDSNLRPLGPEPSALPG